MLCRRSRAIAFKAIADGLPSDAALQARLVRAPYPVTLMHELQLHAWNDVQADGRQYVVDLMDDAGALYEKVRDDGSPMADRQMERLCDGSSEASKTGPSAVMLSHEPEVTNCQLQSNLDMLHQRLGHRAGHAWHAGIA